MGKRQEEPEGGGLPAWMGTYGDLVTLLLCFFVLLFSMSSVDVAKFKAAMSSFSSQIDVMPGGEAMRDGELINNGIDQVEEMKVVFMNGLAIEDDGDDTESKSTTKEIAKDIQEFLYEHGLETDVEVSYNASHVKLNLPGEMLFDSGKAALKKNAITIIDIISGMIIEREYNNYDIEVDGHTDNVPMNSIRFPSNWELSSARAIAVGNRLMYVHKFKPDKIACTGYGEFRPVATNTTAQGRAMNRRVEIKIVVEMEEKNSEILLNK
jgi:chemotaxis protein MotB